MLVFLAIVLVRQAWLHFTVKNQVPEIFRDIALEEKAGYSISEQFPPHL